MIKLPKDKYIDYQVLLSKTSKVWADARKNNDFESFLPSLEKIIEFNKLMVKTFETDELKGYDVLLDMYEDNMGIKEYDQFFDTLREKISAFLYWNQQRKKQRFSRSLTKSEFSVEGQKRVF